MTTDHPELNPDLPPLPWSVSAGFAATSCIPLVEIQIMRLDMMSDQVQKDGKA